MRKEKKKLKGSLSQREGLRTIMQQGKSSLKMQGVIFANKGGKRGDWKEQEDLGKGRAVIKKFLHRRILIGAMGDGTENDAKKESLKKGKRDGKLPRKTPLRRH